MLKSYSLSNWVDSSKLKSPKINTDFYFDIMQTTQKTRSIFVQVEPNSIINATNSIIANANNYDFILSYDINVLASCKNAVKYIYGTTWISKEDYSKINVRNKTFKISVLTGWKTKTNGHIFRHLINKNRNKKLPIVYFYGSHSGKNGNFGEATDFHIGDNKIGLFDTFQYHICIENTQQVNYFTEKLCDCLITKTIPIYWGCPNISEYFDTTGWIILNSDSIDEFNAKVSELNAQDYMKHTNTIEKNYKLAIEYKDVYTNINRALDTMKEY